MWSILVVWRMVRMWREGEVVNLLDVESVNCCVGQEAQVSIRMAMRLGMEEGGQDVAGGQEDVDVMKEVVEGGRVHGGRGGRGSEGHGRGKK